MNLNIFKCQGGPGSPLPLQEDRQWPAYHLPAAGVGAEAVIYPRYCRVLANIFSPGYGRT